MAQLLWLSSHPSGVSLSIMWGVDQTKLSPQGVDAEDAVTHASRLDATTRAMSMLTLRSSLLHGLHSCAFMIGDRPGRFAGGSEGLLDTYPHLRGGQAVDAVDAVQARRTPYWHPLPPPLHKNARSHPFWYTPPTPHPTLISPHPSHTNHLTPPTPLYAHPAPLGGSSWPDLLHAGGHAEREQLLA